MLCEYDTILEKEWMSAVCLESYGESHGIKHSLFWMSDSCIKDWLGTHNQCQKPHTKSFAHVPQTEHKKVFWCFYFL